MELNLWVDLEKLSGEFYILHKLNIEVKPGDVVQYQSYSDTTSARSKHIIQTSFKYDLNPHIDEDNEERLDGEDEEVYFTFGCDPTDKETVNKFLESHGVIKEVNAALVDDAVEEVDAAVEMMLLKKNNFIINEEMGV